MIMKNTGKTLYAIFKNKIHKGNAYGIDKKDAIISHLINAQFPVSNEIINEYDVIEAIEKTHYFKSDIVILPQK